jgi:putative glutamine amidotransferase
MIEYAVSKKIPLLGICRGMQFLGIFFGAALNKIIGHAGARHGLVQSKTGNHNYPKIVNSYHDFYLRDLP